MFEKFVYCDIEKNTIGFYLNVLSLIIEKVIVLIVEVVINIFCIVYFRNFMKEKVSKFVQPNRTGEQQTQAQNGQSSTQNIEQRIKQKENKLFIMFFYFSSITIITNLVIAVGYVLYVRYTTDLIGFYFLFATYLSFSLKHTLTFFVYLCFNYIFRQEFLERNLLGRFLRTTLSRLAFKFK